MFIKYDELDLLELFEDEPVSITGNKEDGKLIYTYKDERNFQLVLTLNTYAKTIRLSITYNDFIVFSGGFNHVTSITKKDDYAMIIHVNEEPTLKVKFYQQVGVELL